MADRGRPRTFATPEDFEAAFDAAAAKLVEEGRPFTLSGLLYHMGIRSRQTLSDYEEIDGFSGPVKKLRQFVEMHYEDRLHGNSPTGAIFALKNMGWKDRQEHDHRAPDGPVMLWGGKSE